MDFLDKVILANEYHPAIVGMFIFVFGTFFGSFLNVVIYRLPVMIKKTHIGTFNLAYPPSRCPKCRTRIRPWQNIPILSYLLLSGRCFTCKASVSLRYPIIEALCGFMVLLLWVWYGPTALFLAMSFLFLSLLALTMIDYDEMLLPDALTIPLIMAGVALSYFGVLELTLSQSLIGAAVGYALFFFLNLAFKLIRKKDGIGGGDIKLMSAAGAWLGLNGIFEVMFLSAIIAIIPAYIASKEEVKPIPFGPYICLSFALTILLTSSPT